MGWYGGGWGWGAWLAMGLMMLAFWGLLAAGVVALVRWAGRDHRWTDRPSGPDPRQLLDERLARGEIDEEEYLRRRDLLTRR